MAEPQPSGVTAGSVAATAEGENPGLKPASKDDAKAAAALDSLDSRDGDEGKVSSSADAAALSGAMKDLKVDGAATTTPAAAEAKKKVKIDAKDVAMVVEHCELRKDRATELLRSNDGDLKRALAAYLTSDA